MEGMHLDPGLYLDEMSDFNALTYDYDPSNKDDADFKQRDSGGSQEVRPLYIPIVVTANEEDHRLMSNNAIYETGSRFFPAQSSPEGGPFPKYLWIVVFVDGESLFTKLRHLNDHLME